MRGMPAYRRGTAKAISTLRSIGIEIANPGHPGGLPSFPEEQIEALPRWPRTSSRGGGYLLTMFLRIRTWHQAASSTLERHFRGEQLHDAGVGHWVPPTPIRDGRFFARGDRGMPVEALQAMLAMYGYQTRITGLFDEDTEKVVAAFQRHFRPERVDGVADASTITTLKDLIARRPQPPV